MPNTSEIIADPLAMEEFGQQLDHYVASTIAECDSLISHINTAVSCGAFSGDAEQEAAARVLAWLKAIKEPLSGTTDLSKRLKTAAQHYETGVRKIKSL